MEILGGPDRFGKLKIGMKVSVMLTGYDGMLKRLDGAVDALIMLDGTGAADDPNNPSRLKGSYRASSAVVPSGIDMLSMSYRAIPVTPLSNVLDLTHPRKWTTLRCSPLNCSTTFALPCKLVRWVRYRLNKRIRFERS